MSGQPPILWRPTPRQAVALASGCADLFFGGARGGGKALAIDTPIPTPTGWTTMGQLQPGDLVLGADGRPTRVLACSEVMHGRPCLRMSFDCGESIVCDEGHLWHTESQGRTDTRLAGVIAATLTDGHRVKRAAGIDGWHYITAADPVPSVPVRCIAVDAPDHLYLCGLAMIPTHNSDYLLLDWYSHAMQQPPVAGILFRRTLPELQEIEARAHALFPRLGMTWKAADREWRHPNGSFLRFRYLESIADASRYQGHQYQWVGADESGAYPSPDVVDLMRGTLRTTRRGQLCLMRLTGNPGGPGHGWLKARYVTPAPPETAFTDPVTGLTRIYIPSRLEDNPHIEDKDQYRRNLAAAGAAHLVRAWLHGDWDILPNGGILRPDLIRNEKPPERERMRTYIGCDPAARAKDRTGSDPDPSAIVVVGAAPDRRFHILEVWTGTAGTLDLWTNLNRIAHRWQPELVWIEGGPIGAAVMPWFEEAQQRAGTWWPLREISHMGDKVGKAQAMAAAIDQGLVVADYAAPWWGAFRDEMTVFDGSDDRHDDRVDAAGIVFRGMRAIMAGAPAPADPKPTPPRSGSRLLPGIGAGDSIAQLKGGVRWRSGFRR